MSIHAADALMGIFGFKRVANDEIVLDNPPSLDDDSGSLNEGMEMEEVKNEGLEVERWNQAVFDLETAEEKTIDVVRAEDYDKALAGYAVRDARIVELERYKRFESLYAEAEREVVQLRAELAAIKAQDPVAYEVSSYGGRVNNIVVREDVALEQADRMISEGAHEVRVRPLYAAPVATPAPIPDADHSEDVLTMVLPDGYKLVPIEPTAAMFKAAKGSGVIDPRVSGYCYQLMLAASTTPGDSQ